MTSSPDQVLQREYDRFIEFGQLLDRRTRRYLVEYLQIAGQRHSVLRRKPQ